MDCGTWSDTLVTVLVASPPRRRRGGPDRARPPTDRPPGARPGGAPAGLGWSIRARRDRRPGEPRRTRPNPSPGSCAAWPAPSPGRHRRCDRRGAGHGHGRRPRGGGAPPARDAQPRGDPLLAPCWRPRVADDLPLSVLEDPAEDVALSNLAIAASRGRRLTAVPIQPDPDGDPHLVTLGMAVDRLGGRGSAGLALDADRGGVAVARCRRPPRRRGTPPHPARARTSASRTGSPIASATSTACGTSPPPRSAWTARWRAPSCCPAGRGPGRSARAASWRRPPSRPRRRSPACTRCAMPRRGRPRTRSRACPTAATSTSTCGLLARRRRAEDRVGVLMVDIDRFKKLNDTFGHAVGRPRAARGRPGHRRRRPRG